MQPPAGCATAPIVSPLACTLAPMHVDALAWPADCDSVTPAGIGMSIGLVIVSGPPPLPSRSARSTALPDGVPVVAIRNGLWLSSGGTTTSAALAGGGPTLIGVV